MRRFSPAAISVVFALAALSMGPSGRAQQQSQPAQDGGRQDQQPAAPQSKKPAAKPKNAEGSSSPQASSSSASYSDSSPGAGPAAADNPFPEAQSEKAAQSSSPDAPPEAPAASPKASADNPFPEDVSRRAAKGDTNSGEKREGQAKDQEPSGVNPHKSADESGREDSLLQAAPGSKAGKPLDPARAKEDTRVGHFYMQSGDYRGAYLRYKDALAYDPANVDAVFGLAEAARALKLVPEAERNYELYLDIVPDGSRAKDAAKALHSLETQR